MHISLYGRHQNLSGRSTSTLLLCFDMRLEDGNGSLHGSCRLHHLRQEHLALTEELTHQVHTIHQRSLDDVHGMRILLQCLVYIRLQELSDTLLQGILQSFLHLLLTPLWSSRLRSRRTARFGSSLCRISLRLDFGSQFDEIIGSTLSSVQYHILDEFELFFRYFIIIHSCLGIYDTKVHTHLLGMMQEYTMNRFADIRIAAEREREVADSTTDMCSRQILMNPLGGTDEFHGIIIMLLHTRSDGKHIRVEDDIERIHPQFIYQEVIGTPGNLDTSLIGSGLSHFIEAHHHDGGTIAHHITCMGEENFFTLLQGDGIHDTFTLTALQSGKNHIPLRGVYHHRHLGNLRFCRYHIEEIHHFCLGIQQSVVHIHVHHGCTICHLLTGNTDGFLITFLINQSQELPTTSHVTAFAYVNEAAGIYRQTNGIIHLQQVQTREPHILRLLHHLMRFLTLSTSGIVSDEFRTGSTAAADDVDDALIDKLGYLGSHRLSRLVILSHLVRQSCIRMGTNIIRCNLCQMLDERFHLGSTEGTVHTYRENRIRRERGQESIHGLTAQCSASQITHRKTDHNRQLYPMLLHHGDGSINHSLAVERIEDGLDEDDISTTFDETIHLFADISEKFIIRNLPGGRITDVRTHGTSFIGRSHISCYEAWFVGCRKLITFDTRQASAFESHLPSTVFQVIISLRNALTREGVRRNDVGARLQVTSVNIRDNIRASDVEHIVVALHHSRHIAEAIASEVFFCKIILLNLSTHGTIQNQNLLLNNLSYILHGSKSA